MMEAGQIPTSVSGVRAIQLQYRMIREIATGRSAFCQSRTQINSPGMGTMMPENFRDVAEVTKQCIELFRLELIQLIHACKRFDEHDLNFGWVSVYMPVRFLQAADSDKVLMTFCDKHEIATNQICFALSGKLLTDSDDHTATVLSNLRNRGFHFMLTEFAADGCQLMRLADFPVDYVMLSPQVTHYIGRSERADNAVQAVIDFVEDLDAKAIAEGVTNIRQAETLHEAGCSYCAGDLAGGYLDEKDVKGRQDT